MKIVVSHRPIWGTVLMKSIRLKSLGAKMLPVLLVGTLTACEISVDDAVNAANAALECEAAQAAPQPLNIITVEATGFQEGNVPVNVIDGDPGTRWASFGLPQSITFDLGNSRFVSRTDLSFHKYDQGRIYSYDIAVSNDNQNWITVVSNATSEAKQFTVKTFTPIHANYVRVTLVSANDTDWAGLREAKVYGLDSRVSSECISRQVNLAWQPGTGNVAGYRVHFGDTSAADQATLQFAIDSLSSSPQTPSVKLDSTFDLGGQPGDNVCFRVSSYNSSSRSPLSNPICVGL